MESREEEEIEGRNFKLWFVIVVSCKEDTGYMGIGWGYWDVSMKLVGVLIEREVDEGLIQGKCGSNGKIKMIVEREVLGSSTALHKLMEYVDITEIIDFVN